MKAVISIAATVMLLVLGSSRITAETYIAYEVRACPNGAKIAVLNKKADEAQAMVDPTRFSLYKQLSLELYRCSTETSDPYLHDTARYFYAVNLWQSEQTNGDTVNNSPQVLVVLNDLAAATKYPDIRKFALDSKKQVKADFDKANSAVNPTPVPIPEVTN